MKELRLTRDPCGQSKCWFIVEPHKPLGIEHGVSQRPVGETARPALALRGIRIQREEDGTAGFCVRYAEVEEAVQGFIDRRGGCELAEDLCLGLRQNVIRLETIQTIDRGVQCLSNLPRLAPCAAPVEQVRIRLLTNGFSMSGTATIMRRYMKLYVYLPFALHPDPKNALLISYGVGNTAKALTDSKSLERIDVVDISRDILELSRIVYPDPSEHPLRDPRVQVHVEDGRHFLQTTQRRFGRRLRAA